MGATAVYELDTEKEKDAQAIFERSQKIQEVGEPFLCEELVLGSRSACALLIPQFLSGNTRSQECKEFGIKDGRAGKGDLVSER